MRLILYRILFIKFMLSQFILPYLAIFTIYRFPHMAAMEPLKQRYQGIQKESAGYKLMSAMGWKEGEGLGATKQGIKEHIKVKKNFENWGVGAVTAAERARDWSTGMADFHRVLSTLSEITSQHAGKRKGEEDSDDDGETTPDEQSDASDGELKKKQAKKAKKESKSKERSKAEKKKKEKKKSKRKSKGESSPDDASDGDTGKKENSEEEDKDEDGPAPKRVKFATHLGRFKKRENAKMVKNYSTHDLAAILGEDPFAAAAAAIAEAQPAAPVASGGGYNTDSESESDEEGVNDNNNASAPRNKNAAKNAPSAGKPPRPPKAPETTAVVHEEEDVDTTEYWWSSYFVRRGKMGSLRRAAPKRERGFSEQDQADLYTAAQDGATQGRVGLGRSSMPKKVAGARWEGKKVRLGSDSESEGEEEEERKKTEVERMEEEEEGVGNGIVIVLPGGKKLPASGSAAAAAAGGGPSDGAGNGKKTKWKKVIAEVLKGEAGGMKMKSLQKAVMEREGLGKESKGEVAAAVVAAVEGSSKFTLEGKLVRLAA